MGFDLAALRKNREARLAKNKALANGEGFEILNTSALAKGVKAWWPKDMCELLIRVVPFQVTKKDNIGGDAVGDIASFRRFKVHYNVGGSDHPEICPTTYGLPCPMCEEYNKYSKEEQKNPKSLASKFKAKDFSVFNALCQIPQPSGKPQMVMRVVRAGYFASYQKILEQTEVDAQFNKAAADDIYLFDDIELGYWMTVRCAKAVSVKGASQPFMQFVQVNLHWQGEKKVVPQGAYPLISDLDLLIPEAKPYATLVAMMGKTVSVDKTYEAEVEEATLGVESGVVEGTVADEAHAEPGTNGSVEESLPGEEAVDTPMAEVETGFTPPAEPEKPVAPIVPQKRTAPQKQTVAPATTPVVQSASEPPAALPDDSDFGFDK
jgi:hypothetical protein